MFIRHPESGELETVLRLAFRHLAPEEQSVRIQSLLESYRNGTVTAEGIFLAEENGQLSGVLYSQLRPDGSVLLFPPALNDGESSDENKRILHTLYSALKHFCNENNVPAAVALADDNQTFDAESFQTDGKFECLSEMVCLVSTVEAGNSVSSPLNFLPMSEVADCPFERMTEVVQKTYKNSKDFPRLMTSMPVPGILRGYQGTAFLPELWFFVQKDGQDIGTLLLTDTRDGQLELTYMGLVEESRRQGLSQKIVRFAQHVTLRRNGLYLLTSVDEQNKAALKTYLANGFRVWDRKRIFVRFF